MDLTGKVLIAMPAPADPRFARSVVLMCRHGPGGAMGLIVNRPLPEVPTASLLSQLKITPSPEARALPVHFGGPVETGRGFVLHSPDWPASPTDPAQEADPDNDPEASASLQIPLVGGEVACLTGTIDILRALATGGGPSDALLVLGYAGWAADQLEGEIARNDWLVAPATRSLLFDTAPAARLEAALRLLGVSPLGLSATGGRA